MADLIDFEKQRRLKQVEEGRDCREWSVRDALQDAIDRIDNGELRGAKLVYIAMSGVVTDETGAKIDTLPYLVAGAGRMEIVGLLEMHKHMMLDDGAED